MREPCNVQNKTKSIRKRSHNSDCQWSTTRKPWSEDQPAQYNAFSGPFAFGFSVHRQWLRLTKTHISIFACECVCLLLSEGQPPPVDKQGSHSGQLILGIQAHELEHNYLKTEERIYSTKWMLLLGAFLLGNKRFILEVSIQIMWSWVMLTQI